MHCHRKLPTLSSVKIEYLPTISITQVQPIDQGIILNLKTHYCKRVLKQISFLIDFKESFDITLLTAVNDSYVAWNSEQPETIEKRF